jgi:hypothetical protein
LLYGGTHLKVHPCMLFSMFIRRGYLQSVNFPFVKNESGDTCDINYYRAIVISTSVSKLFETVIDTELLYNEDND